MNNDFCDEINNNDCIYKNAIEKIKKDVKCKPSCYAGPTGPSGGPTGATGTSQIVGVANFN